MTELSRGLILRLGVAIALIGPIEALDWKVQHAVQQLTPSPLDRPMHAISEAGKPALVMGVLLGLAVFGGAAGVETARQAVLALIPANLAVEGLKRAVHRTRPDGDTNPTNASFPSSHAANAFALAWVFSRRWRRGAPFFFLAAIVVGFSRMYLNRHFLSDVLCAAVIGVVSAWVAERWTAGAKAGRVAADDAPGTG